MEQWMEYKISSYRIRHAWMEGMEWEGEDRIKITKGGTAHRAFFQSLDNHRLSEGFGQLHVKWELPAHSICTAHVLIRDSLEYHADKDGINLDQYLADPQIPSEEKKIFFCREGCLEFVNARDMLLYQKSGRYLWLFLEILECEEGEISQIRVLNPGDNFMQTFPEIYQERGSFFHRYVSVLSTVYRQVQEKIDHLDRILDLDTAPEELLPFYGEWLGIDCGGGFLSPGGMRSLLKQAGYLNSRKGTRQAVSRLVELFVGEQPVVIERSIIGKYMQTEESGLYNRLYGTDGMDVTILIRQSVEESMKIQLEFLLNQFKPVRSRLHIIVLENSGILDSYCYLDYNAQLSAALPAALDVKGAAGQHILA